MYEKMLDLMQNDWFIEVNKNQDLDEFIRFCEQRGFRASPQVKDYRTYEDVPFAFYLYIYNHKYLFFADELHSSKRAIMFNEIEIEPGEADEDNFIELI